MHEFKVRRRVFKKSSFSPVRFVGVPMCVAVSLSAHDVRVLNTRNKDVVLTFTHDEWNAFLKGVRNEEFDLN